MNKGMKRFLAVAACIAIVGSTGISAYSATVSIGSASTANANAGSLSTTTGLITNDYVWQSGATDSVSVNLTGGTLDVTGYTTSLINDTINATSGNLNINGGTFSLDSSSSISSAVKTNIGTDAIFAVTGGSMNLDATDTLDGMLGIESGTLTITNHAKNSEASFIQAGGTTTITGSSFALTNSLDEVYGGTFNIGTSTSAATLKVSNASITNDATVNLSTNSTVNLTGGSLSLDSGDTWGGIIDMSGGTLNINNTQKTGSLSQTDGTVNVLGTRFDLNSTSDNLDGGTIKVGNGSTTSKLNVSKGTITTNSTVNLTDKSTLNVSGGNVTLDADDTINGNLNISSGSLALVGITKSNTTTFTQTGGSTTVTGKTFNLNNENDNILGGDLTIGNGITASKMTISQGAVSDTNINVKERSSLDVAGGYVDIGSGSNWEGSINVSGGELTLDSVTKKPTASFSQTNGKTTVVGTGFDLDNGDDIVSGGIFNIGNKTTPTEVSVSQGYIESNATVNINRNGKLNVSGGEVNLDAGDTWTGDLNVTDGILTITDISKKSSAKFTQSGGETTIETETFDFNNETDKVSGGKLNIASGTTLNIEQGSIESGATVKLNNNTTTNVSGGSLALDNTDTWNGNVNVTGGSLALVGITNKNGVFTQTKGTTTVTEMGFDLNNATDNITGGTLNIGDGTTTSSMDVSAGNIGGNTKVNIANAGSLNVTGGTVSLNKNTTWNGTVNVSEGTLDIDSVNKNASGTFSQSNGTTTVTGTGFNLNNTSDSISGGTFNIGNGTTSTNVGVSAGTIHSSATTNVNSNATLDISGGKVTLDDKDSWNGKVNVSGGSLALVGITKTTDAVFTQTNGTTTISDNVFELNNSNDLLSGGTFNIGTESAASTLNVTKGQIGSGVNTNLALDSTINISGGKVTLDNNDSWSGNVNLTNGTLNLAGSTKNASGTLNQTGGTLTVTGEGNTLNNDNDLISGGNVNIGSGADNGTLNIENGIIETGATVTINENSTLKVSGGTANIDANDRWNGEINVSSGTLNLISNKNNTRGVSSAKFNQSGGTTNIDDSKLVLNDANSKITGGTVNITSTGELNVNNSSENSSVLNSTGGKFSLGAGSKYITTGGTVDEASQVSIVDGATFVVNGESTNVTIDGNNDTYGGHFALGEGTLNFKNGVKKTTSTNGIYSQSSGIANISGGSSLVINDENSQISGGTVNVIDNSELAILSSKNNSSILNVTGSKFALKNNSTYTTTGGVVDTDSVVEIEAGSKLQVNGDTAEVNLTKNDITNGHIEVNNGNLYISDDLTKVTTESGTFVQTGGNTTLTGSNLVLADINSAITGGNVNLKENSTLTFSTNSPAYQGGNIVIDDTSVMNYLASKGLIQVDGGNQINIDTSGLINMANSVRTNNVINNLTINNGELGGGIANFAIDINARSNAQASTDTITANSIRVATSDTEGVIKISDYNLGGDIFGYDAPIERSIRLGKIFKTDDLGKEVTFAATDKEIFTPIGYYKLNPSSANDGSYTFDLTRFNPEVYRGQVSSLASYMNQLSFNDTLFNRAHLRHFASNGEQMLKNKSAVLDGNASYERTLRDGQIWTEVYGNLETLKVNAGIGKVRNNSWGFIVGGDFGLRELKNGWSWMPTAYLAYNGGRQTYNRVGMWQNGAQTGFMGTFMKENTMHSALAYVGVYGANIDLAEYSENAFNYFLGLATKSSYDWKVGSHFKIQPNLTLAYNLFGQQNWHSDYGQMSMTAGFLNGFNIAPGVNFVIDHENWSTYATVAYAWNFIPGMDGSAGHVGLSDIEMKNGYLQYGFGFTRSFSDKFNMYGQATIRNVGRLGVIFQGGMIWRL